MKISNQKSCLTDILRLAVPDSEEIKVLNNISVTLFQVPASNLYEQHSFAFGAYEIKRYTSLRETFLLKFIK